MDMMDMLEKKPQPPVKHGVYNPDSGAPPPQDIDGGSVKPAPKASKPKKMASGGSASSRADGCAQRGKTRGRVI
jgi:hypothetical protein